MLQPALAALRGRHVRQLAAQVCCLGTELVCKSCSLHKDTRFSHRSQPSMAAMYARSAQVCGLAASERTRDPLLQTVSSQLNHSS